MKRSTFTKAIFTCLILSLVGIGQVTAQTTTTTSPQLGHELIVYDALTHGGFTAQTTQVIFAVQIINESDSSVTFNLIPSKITLNNPSNPNADVFTGPFISYNNISLSPGSSQIFNLPSFENPMILKNVSTKYSIIANVNLQIAGSIVGPKNPPSPPVQFDSPVQINEVIFSPTITCTPCQAVYQCGSTLGVNSCGACIVTPGICPAADVCSSNYQCETSPALPSTAANTQALINNTLTALPVTQSAPITTSQVTLVPSTSASEQVLSSGRTGLGVPVPYVSPTAFATPIAFDVAPTIGAKEQWNIGVAWIDICDSISTCVSSNNTNPYESLRMGIHQNGNVFIGSVSGVPGDIHNLTLQNAGGNLGVGLNYIPTQLFDVNNYFGVTSGGKVSVGTATPYSNGGALDITHTNVYNANENAGISIQTGTNAQPELLEGVDITNNMAYIQSASRGTNFTSFPLKLNPAAGTIVLGATTGSNLVQIPSIKASTGTRYVCVDTSGDIISSVSPCGSVSAQTSTGISPDGSTLSAGSTASLVTNAGTWTFSSATGIGGYAILLNGNVVGSAVTLLVYNNGQLYAGISSIALPFNKCNAGNATSWYLWNGNGWTAVSRSPA